MVPYFKKQQLVKCHLLKNSDDEDVRMLYEAKVQRAKAESSEDNPNPVTRGKWQPVLELERQLESVEFQKMTRGARSQHAVGGLGFGSQPTAKKSSSAEEREEMLKAFESQEEERRFLKNHNLEHFGEWVKWDAVMEQDRDWNRLIFQEDDDLFRFEMSAVEDQLPTASVLLTWNMPGMTVENAMCHVCGKKQASLSHILSRCNSEVGQSALKQGRYTWRHDSILLALYRAIRSLRNKGQAVFKLGLKRPAHQTTFTSDKQHEFKTASVEEAVPLFEQSDDWQLHWDLECQQDGQSKNRPFPPHIHSTPKRPDGVMYSDKLKTVMWLELTSPWEENLVESYVRKKGSYNKLESECGHNGWTVIPLYVEVGARGAINTTWGRMSKAMGMSKTESKKLRFKCSKIALRCSYFLYQSRKQKEWQKRPLIEY